ncbi:MAG TPA: hypothetical protein VKC57_09515 [Ktedonobacterales bacterium]|nr:hypothetical protein [Ktedonobacterales bacterium]
MGNVSIGIVPTDGAMPRLQAFTLLVAGENTVSARLAAIFALGFMTAVGVFSLIGWVLLSLRRRDEVTPTNLALFVGGGICSTLGAAWLYGLLFADESNMLQSRSAVLGLFASLSVAGTTGGLLLVLIAKRRNHRAASNSSRDEFGRRQR